MQICLFEKKGAKKVQALTSIPFVFSFFLGRCMADRKVFSTLLECATIFALALSIVCADGHGRGWLR